MKFCKTLWMGACAALGGCAWAQGAGASAGDYALMREMGDEASRLYAAQAAPQTPAAPHNQTAAQTTAASPTDLVLAGPGGAMGSSWLSRPAPKGLALPLLDAARKEALEALSTDVLRAKAEAGDPYAAYVLSKRIADTIETSDATLADAIYWLERSAYAGSVEAMVEAGSFYFLLAQKYKAPDSILMGQFWLQRALAAGDPDIDRIFGGGMYVVGSGDDLRRALPLLARAAEKGDKTSAELLAGVYWNGFQKRGADIPKDDLKGAYFYALSQGKAQDAQALRWQIEERDFADTRAHNALLAKGDSKTGLFAVPGLTPAQFQTLLKAAQKGDDVDACASVGSAYYHGYGTPVNMAESLRWMEQGARMGDLNCQTFAGVRYLMGDGAPLDGNKGAQYLRMGAQRGDPYCTFILAEAYAAGQGGLPKSAATAEIYHLKAAQLGVPYSQFVVAMWMLVSPTETVGRNPAVGLKYARAAAEHGDVQAQMLLAMALLGHAEGVRADPDEGLYWLQRIADTGDTSSLMILGDELFKRYQFAAAAHVFWADASLNANTHAAVMLASLYQGGHGIAQDPAKAVYWFRRAAQDKGPQGREAAQELAQWKDAPPPAADDATGPVTDLTTVGFETPFGAAALGAQSAPAAKAATPAEKKPAPHRYTSTPRFCREDAPAAPAPTPAPKPAPQATPEDGVAALKEAFSNPEILDMLAREARQKGTPADREAAQFYEQRAAALRAAQTPAPAAP